LPLYIWKLKVLSFVFLGITDQKLK
jgi:hypothetical protein